MTLVDTVTSLSERWLRDRTFELIVAPAIADVQFEESAAGMRRLRGELAVVAAFAWGIYEDVTSDPGELVTFTLLTLMPLCYYAMLVAICAPRQGYPMTFPLSGAGIRIAIGLAIVALALAPVLVCYWPERPQRRVPTDTP